MYKAGTLGMFCSKGSSSLTFLIIGKTGILMYDWVCSTLFPVIKYRVLIPPAKSQFQYFIYRVFHICRVLYVFPASNA